MGRHAAVKPPRRGLGRAKASETAAPPPVAPDFAPEVASSAALIGPREPAASTTDVATTDVEWIEVTAPAVPPAAVAPPVPAAPAAKPAPTVKAAPTVTAAPAAEKTPAAEAVPAIPAPSRSRTSAVADLQLILHNRRLLLACFLWAVVPFGVYFGVIVSLHKLADWALFLFAPMVFVGVVIGALLDRAYERVTAPPTAVAEPADEEQLAA